MTLDRSAQRTERRIPAGPDVVEPTDIAQTRREERPRQQHARKRADGHSDDRGDRKRFAGVSGLVFDVCSAGAALRAMPLTPSSPCTCTPLTLCSGPVAAGGGGAATSELALSVGARLVAPPVPDAARPGSTAVAGRPGSRAAAARAPCRSGPDTCTRRRPAAVRLATRLVATAAAARSLRRPVVHEREAVEPGVLQRSRRSGRHGS